MTELEVTIVGEPFKLSAHPLRAALFQVGVGADARNPESLSAVRLGLQSSLRQLGYVPQIMQTDNSSAATKRLGIREERRKLGKVEATRWAICRYSSTMG
ncbi:MAG: hypothetical protein R3A44_17620 [Caldilineaceae bacterium]